MKFRKKFFLTNIIEISDENEPSVLDTMYNGYSPYLLEGWLLVGQHRTFLPFPSYVVRSVLVAAVGYISISRTLTGFS